MKKIILLIVSLLFTIVTFSQSGSNVIINSQKKQGVIRGIIIGVSDYVNIEDLNYADDDALSFYKLLTAFDNVDTANIKLFLNEKARKTPVMLQMNRLISKSNSGDVIYFYFSGHGNTDVLYKTNTYLLMTEVALDGNYSAEGAIGLDFINNQWASLASSKNVKVIIILDACRAGKLITTEENRVMTQKILNQQWANSLKYVSCQANQSSVEGSEWGNGHGAFTYFLIKGIMGESDQDDNQLIIGGELGDYLVDSIRLSTNRKQTPIYSGTYDEQLFSTIELNYEKAPIMNIKINNNALATISNKEKGIQNKIYVTPVNNKNKNLVVAFNQSISKKRFIPVIENSLPKFILNIGQSNFVESSKQSEREITINNMYPNIFATGNEDKYIRIWDIKKFDNTKRYENIIGPQNSGITGLCFSSDGNYIISSDYNGELYIWDWRLAKLLTKFKPFNQGYLSFNIMKNEIIATSRDKKLRVFSIDSLLNSNSNCTEYLLKYSLSKITSDEENDFIWGISNGNIIKYDFLKNSYIEFSLKSNHVIDYEISPNKKNLLYTNNRGVSKLIDITSKKELSRIYLSTSQKAVFDASSKYIYISDMNRHVKIWDIDKSFFLERSLKSPHSITSMIYNNFYNRLQVCTYAWESDKSNVGSINVSLKINIPNNAYHILYILQSLISNDEYTILKNRLYTELVKDAEYIGFQYIKGTDIKPNTDNIIYAIKEMGYAMKLYEESPLIIKSNIIMKLFLEAVLILEENDIEKFDEGINKCDSIMKIDPYAVFPYNLIGELYKKRNDLESSKINTKKTISFMPIWTEPKANLGKTLIIEGEFEKSIEEFNKIIKLQPQISKGYINLGIVYTIMNKYDDAELNFEKALSVDNENQYIYIKYAELETKRYNYEKAIKLLKQANIYNNKYYLLNLSFAKVYEIIGEYSKAEKKYLAALKNNPRRVDVLIKFAFFEMKRGQYVHAKALIDTALIIDGNYYEGYLARGDYYNYFYKNIQSDTAFLKSAIDSYNKALDLAKFNSETYYKIAKSLFELSILENNSLSEKLKVNALKYLYKAEELNSYNYLIKKTLKENLVQDTDSLKNKLYNLNNLHPKSSEIKYSIAILEIKNSDNKNAEKLLIEATKINKYYFEAQYALLELYKNTNNKKYNRYLTNFNIKFKNNPQANYGLWQTNKNKTTNNLRNAKTKDLNFLFPRFAYSNGYGEKYIKLGIGADFYSYIYNKNTHKIEYRIYKFNSKYGLIDNNGLIVLKFDYSLKKKDDSFIFKNNGKEYMY